MSAYLAFLSIIGAIFLGAISPGPSFALVSRISISGSRAEGLAAALGMGLGGAVLAGLALGGLTAVLQQAEWIFRLLKICGGLYLVYLAIRIVRGATAPIGAASSEPSGMGSVFRSLRTGALVQLSNPKTIVVYGSIFAALLPQDPPLWLMAALLPAIFAVEAGWYAAVALVFSAPWPKQAYLRAKAWIDRAVGVVLGGLGLRLALDGLGVRLG
ncbi:LysE family transporter [Rhizobium sp. RU36D]|uniref:LysE family translocator n=1 Tax=Rhizobium sp. RU36D TaxID=1907415 RepID=UPI0009D8DFAF|nr:LysE family transporter [Rhizobium sp. RU36D]SMD09832.1 Threonine/homoserine/homoserine lactone efflux protein [Rhizobium sp. RU36D]